MERSEVKEQNKWRLEDIFVSDDEWEKTLDKLTANLQFSQYAGKLSDKCTLLEFLKKNDEYCIALEKLAAYASMKHDEDTRVAKYNSYDGKVQMLYSRYCSEVAFYEPELASCDDAYLNSLISDPQFSDYDYQLKKLIEGKAHIPSEEQSKVVALAGETLSTFRNIFGMIDNADLPLPEIEVDGKREKLTHGLYGILLHSPDRELRKQAYEKYYAAYTGLINTLTANYYGNVKKDVFLSRVYKFGSCLEQALFYEDVDKQVYDNLLKSVHKNSSVMHRYIIDRKKLLGCDKMYFYDIYAPLVADCDLKMNFDDAYEYVVEGLSALGKDYQKLLRDAKNGRWIDVEETEGKRNGAYSARSYGVHPFVLLNYKPSINDVFTIAHEMGHSVHTYFSQKGQPYAKSDYKIFVAEVASTVNEVLLLKNMLATSDDVNFRKYLLNYYLDSIRATLHRQTMFAEFEYLAHKKVEDGEPLTKENLCEIYGNLGRQYYGEEIEHDYQISCEWARIPHFYSSFYVYKYATGITAAINIVNRILAEGDRAISDYFRFLSGGSSADPVSLLKLAGVDLTSEGAFDVAMKEFENTLLQFEKLMGI